MTTRSTKHSMFTIERVYDAAPERVFAAWADPAAKTRWFGGPDGVVYTYEAVYRDIAPNERIVYTYEMYMGDARISVSVTAVELAAEGASTRLTFTEHGVFLDGLDSPALREEGTGHLLDALGADLRGEPVVGW